MVEYGDPIITLEDMERIVSRCESENWVEVPSGLTENQLIEWLLPIMNNKVSRIAAPFFLFLFVFNITRV